MSISSFGLRVRTNSIATGGLITNASQLMAIPPTAPILTSPMAPPTVEQTQQQDATGSPTQTSPPAPTLLPPTPLGYGFSTVKVPEVVLQVEYPSDVVLDVDGNPTTREARDAANRPSLAQQAFNAVNPAAREAAANSVPLVVKNALGIAGAREALNGTVIGEYIEKNQAALGTISPKAAEGLNIPTYPVYRSFPINQIRPAIIPPDSLQLSDYTIQNASVQAVFKNQRVRKRPDIIALSGFNRVFQDDLVEFTDAGRFISFNYQSRILRDDMVKTMYDYVVKNSDRSDITTLLQQDEQRDLDTLANADRFLSFYNQKTAVVNSIKQLFDIKQLPNSAYTNNDMLTLPDFFERKMRYSRQSYNAFSDTKILAQLLFDFRSMMSTYSLSLLDTLDSDRTNDLSAISIDKSYGNTNRFTFTTVGIQGVLPYVQASFNSFMASLPTSPDERLKLLFNTMTKELRVSRGLSKQEIRSLLSGYFGGNADGDPFDNVVGNVGDDIFVAPQGRNSLASLLQFSREDVVTVLPFENRFVDDNQTIFVPGTRYFIDSLLERTPEGNFNTRPLDEYTQRFSEVLANSKRVVEELLQLSGDTDSLTNSKAFKSFLEYVKDSTSTFEDSSTPTDEQLTPIALFKLAETDKSLKLMLFQYILLLMLTKNIEMPIVRRLATELQGIGSLSFVRGTGNPSLIGGSAELSPYLDRLVDDIIAKVANMLGISPPFNQSPVNGIGLENQPLNGFITDNDVVLDKSTNEQNSSTSPGDQNSSVVKRASSLDSVASLLKSPNRFVSTLFSNFANYIHSLDQAATIVGNQNSYVLGGTGDSATTTRFNQLTTSMIIMLAFECVASFANKYFDATFTKSTAGLFNLSFDLGLNSSTWEQLFSVTQAAGAGESSSRNNRNTTPASSVDSSGQRQDVANSNSTNSTKRKYNRSTSNRNQTNINPNNDVELDVDGNPRPRSTPLGAATRALQESIAGRLPADIGFATAAATTLPPSIADLAREAGTRVASNANSLSPVFLRKINAIRDSLRSVIQKLTEEDLTIKNVTYIFNVIGDVLKRASDQARMMNLIQLPDESVKSNIIPSQLRLANYIYSEYKQLITDPTIQFRSRVVHPNDWRLLKSLMKETPFQNQLASTRTKLLVVGVPKGYSEYLYDRIDRRDLASSSGDKFAREYETDVINIVVYKKTAEDDDIVFFPKRFTFDLSLFRKTFNSDEVPVDETQSFNTLLSQLSLYDFTLDRTNNRDGIKFTLDKLLSDERYDFLSTQQRRELFRNHLTSYLLSVYMYLATGMRMTEEVFPELPYLNYTNNSGWLISEFDRLRTGIEIPLETLMASQKYNFMYSVTSGFSPEYIMERVLNNKKFDRVFIIPIDIDSFVIDREATLSTQSGRGAMSANRFQQRTQPVRPGDNELLYFDRSSEPNALIFEQYYVTVESVR